MVQEITEYKLLQHFGFRQPADIFIPVGTEDAVIDKSNLGEFIETATNVLKQTELRDILHRAINFSICATGSHLEVSFISLYAALESVLTFFRRQDEYEIMPSEEFGKFERDLKRWLKQHPVLTNESAKRGLIYEKIRELNRFPFSHVFQNFCERYSLDLSDLWPVLGSREEWPLMEIRHRLVHGDPFTSRPYEAMLCAHMNLRWTVERMLLSVLNWPIARSNVSRERLLQIGSHYQNWQTERAKFR